MTERDLEEYKALRATIRQRGSARPWVFLVGFSVWAIASMGATATSLPLMTVLPLLLLFATFEVVFSLHVGVERIGRYLQVFHDDRWEATAMAFGAPMAGTGTDPLFVFPFALAPLCNFVPVLLVEPVRVELVALAAVHLLFLVRIFVARRAAGNQRAADLDRFRLLLGQRNSQQ
jgi:hypothetical protein